MKTFCLKKIEEAKEFFVLALGVAQGCNSVSSEKVFEEKYEIDRDFRNNFNLVPDYKEKSKAAIYHKELYKIRGIYLHRLSEIVDFAKLFYVICEVIQSKKENDVSKYIEDRI